MFSDNKPIYLQLADQIMDEVVETPGLEGSRIPSVREYASRSSVNANTVMRAYAHLQQEGIIFNQRGIGYFYCTDARKRVLDTRRSAMLGKEIYEFMDRLISLQISPEDFYRLFTEYKLSQSRTPTA